MALHHPRCPEHVHKHVLWAVRRRRWPADVTIGQAVGIVLQNFVRHHMTRYDDLYKIPGITQEEARIIIRSEVTDIVRSFGPEVVLRLAAPRGSKDHQS